MANDEFFSVEDPYAPPSKSKGGCLIVSIIAGVVVGLGVLAIGGCSGLVYFAMESMIAPQIVSDLKGHPVMEEYIGSVTSTDFIFGESFNADDDVYIIDVVGTQGGGRLRVTALEAGEAYDVVAGTLTMPDGTEHDLFPHEPDHAE